MSNLNKDKVGKLFTIDGDDIWELTSFMSEPSATMTNLRTGEQLGGSIYSLNLGVFEEVEIVKIGVKEKDRQASSDRIKNYTSDACIDELRTMNKITIRKVL